MSGSVGREACAARVSRTSLLERPQESNSMDMSHRICMPSLAISQPGSTRQRAVWIRSQMYRVPTPPRHERNAPRQLTSPVTSRPHRHQCMSTVGGRIHICICTPCRMRDESITYFPDRASYTVAPGRTMRCSGRSTMRSPWRSSWRSSAERFVNARWAHHARVGARARAREPEASRHRREASRKPP